MSTEKYTARTVQNKAGKQFEVFVSEKGDRYKVFPSGPTHPMGSMKVVTKGGNDGTQD